MEASPPPRRPLVRTVLLGIGATWLLLTAFMRPDDTIVGLEGIVQRVAFGLALIAVALIEWQRFRWWWLLVALLAVAFTWTATGHPLLFLVGGM